MNHKFSGAFIWEKMLKKKKKSLLWRVWYWTRLLVVFLCLYHSPTAHSTGPVDSWTFVFVDPSYTHTHARAYMGSNKTPLELSQNEIKFQGIMCFEQRVLLFMLFAGVAVVSVWLWRWDAVFAATCVSRWLNRRVGVCVRGMWSEVWALLLKHQRYL